jgi:hypothetical protein
MMDILPGSKRVRKGRGWQGREMAQIMYIHMNKCINNKNKK